MGSWSQQGYKLAVGTEGEVLQVVVRDGRVLVTAPHRSRPFVSVHVSGDVHVDVDVDAIPEPPPMPEKQKKKTTPNRKRARKDKA